MVIDYSKRPANTSRREWKAIQKGTAMPYSTNAADTNIYSGKNIVSALSNPSGAPDYSNVANLTASLNKTLDKLTQYDLGTAKGQAQIESQRGVGLVPMGRQESEAARIRGIERQGIAAIGDTQTRAVQAAKDAYAAEMNQYNQDRSYNLELAKYNHPNSQLVSNTTTDAFGNQTTSYSLFNPQTGQLTAITPEEAKATGQTPTISEQANAPSLPTGATGIDKDGYYTGIAKNASGNTVSVDTTNLPEGYTRILAQTQPTSTEATAASTTLPQPTKENIAQMQQYITTDANGNKYVDLTQVTDSKEKQYLSNIAKSQGLRVVAKQPSQQQTLAAGYAGRALNADQIITDDSAVGAAKIGYISGSKYFPNFLKSSERQTLEQAQRDFVNAVLRQESGAAISESEFENAAKQYFPQPGDSEAVIKQKAANRAEKIRDLQNQAGSAYYAPSRSSTQTSSGNNYSLGGQTTPSGNSYTITPTQ